jgi:hypothetical protein
VPQWQPPECGGEVIPASFDHSVAAKSLMFCVNIGKSISCVEQFNCGTGCAESCFSEFL